MRPKPYEFETADGQKFSIDCLSLAQIRSIEDIFADNARVSKMRATDLGMELLGIFLSQDYPDVDVEKLRIVGGAQTLAEITKAVMVHGGMELSEGKQQPVETR